MQGGEIVDHAQNYFLGAESHGVGVDAEVLGELLTGTEDSAERFPRACCQVDVDRLVMEGSQLLVHSGSERTRGVEDSSLNRAAPFGTLNSLLAASAKIFFFPSIWDIVTRRW